MVDVAQLVEPRIVIPVVAGSIPVVHPINSLYKSMIYHYFRCKYWKFDSILTVLLCNPPRSIKLVIPTHSWGLANINVYKCLSYTY
jgi:hypothetical protein